MTVTTPSHVARNTVRYLKRENLQFITPICCHRIARTWIRWILSSWILFNRWHIINEVSPHRCMAVTAAAVYRQTGVSEGCCMEFVVRQNGACTLFSEIDSNKLRFHAENEKNTWFIAKFGVDLVNIYKVAYCNTEWPHFWPTLQFIYARLLLEVKRMHLFGHAVVFHQSNES